MKKAFWIYKLMLVGTLITSCADKSFLDNLPLDTFPDEKVWNDPALVENYVNSIYRNSMGYPFAIERLSDYCDESYFPPDWGTNNFNNCEMSSTNLWGWGTSWSSPQTIHLSWDSLYVNIHRTNLFFLKINKVKSDEKAWLNRLKGEVYFLRAWNYHYLVALYGGVPIITKVYGINEDYTIARNSYEECINFISGQLDSAAKYLPVEYSDIKQTGRATKGAALALKSRVLLYAASDLHHLMSVYAPGFSNPELLGYTDGNHMERWIAAKNAAKAVIDLNKYDLYKKNPSPGDSIAQNFVEFFLSKGTEEDILLQFFTSQTNEDWNGYNPAMYCGPPGYHNWGNNAPLGDLADDYEMKDGSKFEWNKPIHKANPYNNRDARFYATILYEGARWRKRPDDYRNRDPFDKIQVGSIYNSSGIGLLWGLDTQFGPVSTFSGRLPGYFLRKFIDPSVDPQFARQDVPFKHIRFAEVLLNYAEACLELGEIDEARTNINLIRKRAGQPDLPLSLTSDQLRQACRHERRIELAFEDHRFWDIRRWMIGSMAYKQTSGIIVKYTTDFNVTTYRKEDGATWGDPVYTKADVPGDPRAWNNKAYFFPIMSDELSKNNKLIQNPGY